MTEHIVDDIAALARKLAVQEPFKSAGGAEALQAFARHLDEMMGRIGARQPRNVNVAVRVRRKKSA